MINFIKKILKIDKKRDVNKNFQSSKNKLPIHFALSAETNRKIGNCDLALQEINRAIELDSVNDMFYVTRALIFLELDNFDCALKDINKALELNDKVEQTNLIKKEIVKRKETLL